jgi:hypothetical protein
MDREGIELGGLVVMLGVVGIIYPKSDGNIGRLYITQHWPLLKAPLYYIGIFYINDFILLSGLGTLWHFERSSWTAHSG